MAGSVRTSLTGMAGSSQSLMVIRISIASASTFSAVYHQLSSYVPKLVYVGGERRHRRAAVRSIRAEMARRRYGGFDRSVRRTRRLVCTNRANGLDQSVCRTYKKLTVPDPPARRGAQSHSSSPLWRVHAVRKTDSSRSTHGRLGVRAGSRRIGPRGGLGARRAGGHHVRRGVEFHHRLHRRPAGQRERDQLHRQLLDPGQRPGHQQRRKRLRTTLDVRRRVYRRIVGAAAGAAAVAAGAAAAERVR